VLFATIGEIFAERSGVMNLGVEGMMLIGAMAAFSTAVNTGNPWLGVLVAMLAAGLLSQIHAFLTITLQSDQVVSGLALTFLGTGISLVLGEGLSKAGTTALLPVFTIPVLSVIPGDWARSYSRIKTCWCTSVICSSRWRGISSIARGPACTCAR
jgi:simple sugar transport system permease protein